MSSSNPAGACRTARGSWEKTGGSRRSGESSCPIRRSATFFPTASASPPKLSRGSWKPWPGSSGGSSGWSSRSRSVSGTARHTMGESPRRVLLADTNPSSRTTLEPLVRAQGWEILSVESSFQVLRTVRDASVDIVLINPDLPGSGVTGADVAKTLKSATQFRHLPVLFLLHGGRAEPTGIPVDGSIDVERSGPERISHTIKQALGLAGPASAPGAAPPEAMTPPRSEALLKPLTNLIERLAAR